LSIIDTPLHREPVEIDGRAMTPARRARIIARDGGHCRYPECEVATGLEVDHIVALELGGRDRDENLQTLCHDHHKAKTKLDAALIAKARRRKAKAEGTFPPSKAKIRGGGFRPTREWSERDV
jgi:5-methylcytosine-specific restriction protein A